MNGAIKVVTACIVDVRDNNDRPDDNKPKSKAKPKSKPQGEASSPTSPRVSGNVKKRKGKEKKQEVLKGDTLSQETTKLDLQSKAKRMAGRGIKEEALPSIANATSGTTCTASTSVSSDKTKPKVRGKKTSK